MIEKFDQEMLNKIIYDTLRGIHDVSKKLKIATSFIFIMNDNKLVSQFMYGNESINYWIEHVNNTMREYTHEDGETIEPFSSSDREVDEIFTSFKKELASKFDYKKFYKSLYEDDEWAIATNEILLEFQSFKKNVSRRACAT